MMELPLFASVNNAVYDIINVQLHMRVTSGAWGQARLKHVIWTAKQKKSCLSNKSESNIKYWSVNSALVF